MSVKEKEMLSQAEIWVTNDQKFTDEQKKHMLNLISMLLDDEGRHKRAKQWELEVRYGLTGWLQNNWPQLCKIQCECGDLISYDALRASNELICNKCYKQKTECNTL